MSELLTQPNGSKEMPVTMMDDEGDTFQDDVSGNQQNGFLDKQRPKTSAIRIIPNSREENRDLILQVKRSFMYVPDESTVLNAMLVSGEFDIQEVGDHICKIFSRPSKTTLDERQILRLKLLPDPFKIAKDYKVRLATELVFPPDIHTVTNALFCTGDFKPEKVVVAICNMYQKAKNLKVSRNPNTM